MLAFKTFSSGRKGSFQTSYQYPPEGKWSEKVRPKVCSSGFHVANAFRNLPMFVRTDRPVFYLVEVRGKSHSGGERDKVAYQQIRLVRKLPITRKLLENALTGVGVPPSEKEFSWSGRYKKKTLFRLLEDVCKNISNKNLRQFLAEELNVPESLLSRSVQKVITSVRKRKRNG